MNSIYYWNRKTAQEEAELVYGEKALKWVYETSMGQSLSESLLSRHWLSRLYGSYQSSRWSRHKVAPFIQAFKIPMEEYESGPFESFNDFFIRKFRPGARSIEMTPKEMPAFSEARYFAFDKITMDQKFPVKGKALSAEILLGGIEKAKPFIGGPLLLARLCPTDYHRFHFPDSGKVMESYTLHGPLHSVNPTALKYKEDILVTNERQVTLMETSNFGKLAYVEVGALCVGKIVQTYNGTSFERGQEKGYFLFGASTVIVVGEPGRWAPHADLVAQTLKGRETLVRLGEAVAKAR